jgi:hypothetical protein
LIATHLEQLAPHLLSDVDGRPLTALGAPDCGTNRGAKLIRRQRAFDEAPANVERVIDSDWLRPSIDPENDLAHSPEAKEVALAAVDDAADVLEEADPPARPSSAAGLFAPSRSSDVPFGVPCLCSRCG